MPGILHCVVRMAQVAKSYGRHVVLDGVDLALTPGEPVVVTGGNGSGKSTLLRIVAGCTAPSRGTVTGRPTVVGYLPAPFPASARMPVRAYLRHLAAVHGRPDADPAPLLDALGFTGAPDGPVAHLSTGNAQKVGLVQALSCAPGLLVLDEPWTALDAAAAVTLDGLLAAQTCAVLVADHSGRAAELPGAHVHRLDGGRLAAAAPPEPVTATAMIALRCPGPHEQALQVLPPVLGSWADDAGLTVRVRADRGDALLAAALAAGCSVVAVWQE